MSILHAKKRGPPRGEQYRVARHLEKRATPKGQYRAQRHPFPNASEFGKQAEWVDAFGRQYRLALYQHPMEWTPGVAIPLFDPLKRQEIMEQQVKQGRGRLWVRLDKGAGPDAWFTPGELAMHQEVTLRPVMDGVPPLEIHLMTAQRRLPKGRTGLVTVTPASFVV